MVFKLWQKQILFYVFLLQGFLHVLAWKEKLSLGCDAGMEMMEEEFEKCRMLLNN